MRQLLADASLSLSLSLALVGKAPIGAINRLDSVASPPIGGGGEWCALSAIAAQCAGTQSACRCLAWRRAAAVPALRGQARAPSERPSSTLRARRWRRFS